MYYMKDDDFNGCILYLRTEYDTQEIEKIKGKNSEQKAEAIIEAIIADLEEWSRIPNNNLMIVDVAEIMDKILNVE